MRRPDEDRGRSRGGDGGLLRGGDRAQSEALGFALLFATIVLILGIVVTVGYANLADARDHERVTNVERGFEAFAANVDEVVRNDATSRSTELAVADGGLVTRPGTTMTVEWRPEGGSWTEEEVSLTALVYTDGSGDRVVYEGGAVFREDDAGAVLQRGPPVRLDKSRTIVPIVNLTGSERVGAAGKELVSLRTERADSEVLFADTDATYTLNITITGPRAEAWQDYLVARSDGDCSRSDDGVVCKGIERLTVVHVAIAVSESS